MDYQTCLEQFISILRAEDGDEADIAFYRSYPTPSAAEWADVLKMVASDGGPTGPVSCIVLYEVLLERRGLRTRPESPLEKLAIDALRAGTPPELISSILSHSWPECTEASDPDRRRVH
jgi:hypothetical protein